MRCPSVREIASSRIPTKLVEARGSVMSGRRVSRQDVARDDAFWWRDAYDRVRSVENEQSPGAGAAASGGGQRRRWSRRWRRRDQGHGSPIAGPAEQRAEEAAFLDLRVSNINPGSAIRMAKFVRETVPGGKLLINHLICVPCDRSTEF